MSKKTPRKRQSPSKSDSKRMRYKPLVWRDEGNYSYTTRDQESGVTFHYLSSSERSQRVLNGELKLWIEKFKPSLARGQSVVISNKGRLTLVEEQDFLDQVKAKTGSL